MSRITNAQKTINAAAAEALHIEQQAALKQARADKRAKNKEAKLLEAAKPSVKEHVETTQPDAEHVNIEDLFDGITFPSPRRVIAGVLLGIAAAFCVGYGIGMLIAYALAGILTLTASPAIALALSVITWLLGIYASWKLGGYIGGKVFASVVLPEGLAARSYESVAGAVSSTASSVKNKVGGWFTAKPVEPAFTGAHAA